MKYEAEIKKFIGDRVKYDTNGGGYIWGQTKNDHQMIAQVVDLDEPDAPVVSIRGWGAIQNKFKTYEESVAFQDALGKFIEEAINEKLQKLNQS